MGRRRFMEASRGSRVPFARTVVGEAALLTWAEVVHGRRHGNGKPERKILADIADVVHRPARHPYDVVLLALHDDTARQLPLESSREHHPPFVELAVPVGAIAAARGARDEGDEVALVGDDPL